MDWKFNILTGITALVIATAVLLDLYTIYVVDGNFFKIIDVLSLQALLIPGTFKLYLMWTSMKDIMSLYQFVEEVYDSNSYGPKAEILTTNTKRITRQIFYLLCLAMASFSCSVGYPLYKLICHGELIPLLTLEIPYVDQSDTSGLIIANLIMMFYGLYGSLATLSFDIMFSLTVMLHSSLVTLLKYDLKQLGNMWQNKDETTEENLRNAYLRNIIIEIGDVDRYARKISDIYSNFIFVQMATTYICLILIIFAVIVNRWMSGIGLALYCFAEMFLMCYLGTTLTNQNEKLCFMIYDHPWYLYTKRTQKLFILLLHMVQNSTELTIGRLALLNVETGMRMTNNIYSYLTMLISIIE